MDNKNLDNEAQREQVITKVRSYGRNKPFPSRSTVIIQIILSLIILSVPLILSAKIGLWDFLSETNLMVLVHLVLLSALTGVLVSIANYKFDLKNQAEKVVLVFPLITAGFYILLLLTNYLRTGKQIFYIINVFITMSQRYLIMIGFVFSIYVFINAIKNTKR